MTEVLAQATTSTTSVPRVVGDPPATWVTVSAGLALLVAIVVLGLLVNRRRRAAGDLDPSERI